VSGFSRDELIGQSAMMPLMGIPRIARQAKDPERTEPRFRDFEFGMKKIRSAFDVLR
jgi:hypothetical protein